MERARLEGKKLIAAQRSGKLGLDSGRVGRVIRL